MRSNDGNTKFRLWSYGATHAWNVGSLYAMNMRARDPFSLSRNLNFICATDGKCSPRKHNWGKCYSVLTTHRTILNKLDSVCTHTYIVVTLQTDSDVRVHPFLIYRSFDFCLWFRTHICSEPWENTLRFITDDFYGMHLDKVTFSHRFSNSHCSNFTRFTFLRVSCVFIWML